jgi:hypothetical protein
MKNCNPTESLVISKFTLLLRIPLLHFHKRPSICTRCGSTPRRHAHMEFEGILIVHHLANSRVMILPLGLASGRLAGANFNPGTRRQCH